jgi:hypothetical protein
VSPAKIQVISPGKIAIAVTTSAVVLALTAVFTGMAFAVPAEAREGTNQTKGQEYLVGPDGSSRNLQSLFDDFDTIRAKPRSGAPWYIINWGSKNGEWRRWEGRPCGSDSCVRARRSDGVSFAKLSIFPSDTRGFYTNAELAE